MNKAVFLDLDGTLIKTKTGYKFPKDKNDWKFNSNILNILKEYISDGYYILIVSNQGGIAKKTIKKEDFEEKIQNIVNEMITFFSEKVVKLDEYDEISKMIDYNYCPNNDRNDPDRKPNTGMAEKFAKKYDLNLEDCIMVGDASGLKGQFSDSDKIFATNSGIGTYYDISNFLEK